MKKLAAILILSTAVTSCSLLEWRDKLLSAASDRIPWSFEESMGDQMLPSILELGNS